MESLFKRGIKKECEKVGGMFSLMKQLDRSHALILSNCFVGKEKKNKTRRGGEARKKIGVSLGEAHQKLAVTAVIMNA